MGVPRRQRQWEIYRANLGEGEDIRIMVLSSNETNEILDRQVLACEVLLESVERVAETPVTIPAPAAQTGLAEPANISVATLASIPRNCLVELEGRLDSIALRMGVNRGIQILLGNQRWP
ncbi:MAG: hypothetical protein HYZ75_11760 [Elusimicrobia bacterium]|nr:hypothetical protein [Elusimicrobiota bacterium]